MLDLYVLQVKKGNLIWLNFWFLKIVQSMEFTLNLYSLFFFFFFQKLWNFFSLCLIQSLITTEWSITFGSCMYKQQFRYCRIIITKWSTSHCSSLFGFLSNFPQNNPLSFFLFFFLSIYHQFGFGENRERVFFIKSVLPILLLYQLLSS